LKVTRFLPLITRLRSHNRRQIWSDIIAGITVAIVLVPQAIAYAYLAGMPPIYGLYASFVPMFLYGLIGTSPQMNVGPVAISAVLVLSGISAVAEPLSPAYIDLVILTALLVGIAQLIMGLLRMGFIVNFLSHPVLTGFLSAAAIIIIISQIKELFGLDVPRLEFTMSTLWYELTHIDEINPISTIIGISTILILALLKRLVPKIPGIILVVVVAGLASYIFKWTQYDVRIIGALPSGLPTLLAPNWNLSSIGWVMPTVLTVTYIGFVESLSISKGMEMKHRSYRIDANQELYALGISKIVGSFFQALPSSGSFTRSALNDAAGSQSGLSSIVSSLLVGLTLLFFTDLFYHIPHAVLAAIIIFSVVKIIDIDEVKYLYKIRRRDLGMMLTTFVLTVALGIEIGVLSGVVLSILYILYQNSRPNVFELGNVRGTNHYRNVNRFPQAITHEDHLIVRFDNQLFFANSAYFKDEIMRLIESKPIKPQYLILDASNIYDMDSTGLHALEDLYHQLGNREIQLVISGAKGTVRDIFKRSGFFEKLEKTRHFMYIKNAIAYTDSDDLSDWNEAVTQSNY